jgi:hypothetical protein
MDNTDENKKDNQTDQLEEGVIDEGAGTEGEVEIEVEEETITVMETNVDEDNQQGVVDRESGAEDTGNQEVMSDGATDTGERNKVESILRLDRLIKGYLTDIKKMREKTKTQKEMLNSAFENDADYQKMDKEVRDLNKKKTEIKQKILNQKANVEIKEELMNIQDEIKEASSALSDYLKEYEKLTNATEFETDDGELLQILHDVKLKKKSNR